MAFFRRGRKDELEATADVFLRKVESPAPPDSLREYGLQRIYARRESGEKAGAVPAAGRAYRNPALLHRAVLVVLIVVLVMVITSTGAYALSYNAQPDSVFYPAKIFFERARIAFTSSASGDIRLEMDYSNRRLEELEKMVASGNQGGAERWLHEYVRNIEGARALIDTLPEEEFASIAPQFQEMLDGQAHMMEGMRHGPPQDLSDNIEKAYETCNREREHMRRRCGNMDTDGSSPSQGGPDQDADPGGNGGNCGPMDGTTSPGNTPPDTAPAGESAPMMEGTQPARDPAGAEEPASMWQRPAAGWEQAKQESGEQGEGSHQKGPS